MHFGNVKCRFDFAWVKCDPKSERGNVEINFTKMAKYCWFASKVSFILDFLLHHLHRSRAVCESHFFSLQLLLFVCVRLFQQKNSERSTHNINHYWATTITSTGNYISRVFNSEAHSCGKYETREYKRNIRSEQPDTHTTNNAHDEPRWAYKTCV